MSGFRSRVADLFDEFSKVCAAPDLTAAAEVWAEFEQHWKAFVEEFHEFTDDFRDYLKRQREERDR